MPPLTKFKKEFARVDDDPDASLDKTTLRDIYDHYSYMRDNLDEYDAVDYCTYTPNTDSIKGDWNIEKFDMSDDCGVGGRR